MDIPTLTQEQTRTLLAFRVACNELGDLLMLSAGLNGPSQAGFMAWGLIEAAVDHPEWAAAHAKRRRDIRELMPSKTREASEVYLGRLLELFPVQAVTEVPAPAAAAGEMDEG